MYMNGYSIIATECRRKLNKKKRKNPHSFVRLMKDRDKQYMYFFIIYYNKGGSGFNISIEMTILYVP